MGGSTSKVKPRVFRHSAEVIQAHAMAIEAYIHNYVGENNETGNMGKMYLGRTLEDWIGFKIDNRTKYDLSISSGLCLLAAQVKTKKVEKADFSAKKFFRRYNHNA